MFRPGVLEPQVQRTVPHWLPRVDRTATLSDDRCLGLRESAPWMEEHAAQSRAAQDHPSEVLTSVVSITSGKRIILHRKPPPQQGAECFPSANCAQARACTRIRLTP